MPKYYFPLNDEETEFLCLYDDICVICNATPDPFSRVAAPPLKSGWAEGLYLTKEIKQKVENAKYVYTKIWKKE